MIDQWESMYLPKEGLSLKENLPGPRIKSEALLSPLPLKPDFSSFLNIENYILFLFFCGFAVTEFLFEVTVSRL
jgi:hypothetical protein